MPRNTATNHRSKASRRHDVGNRSHKSVTWVQAPISLVRWSTVAIAAVFFFGVGVVPPKENDEKILAANFLKLKFIKIQWQSDSEHQWSSMQIWKTCPAWHPNILSCQVPIELTYLLQSKGLFEWAPHKGQGFFRDLCLKRNVHQQIPAKSHEIPNLLSPNNGSIWVLSSFDCSH